MESAAAMLLMPENSLNDQGILAVLVLYERQLQDAEPWPLLLSWLMTECRPRLRHCLIYDNSSKLRDPQELPDHVSLVWNPENGGTREAYIAATECATRHDCEWLLLLDQDTVLPAHYLDYAQASSMAMPDAIALVPSVWHGSQRISPASITKSGSIRPCEYPDKKNEIMTAVSSGTLIRGTAIVELAFPPEIWLDYVDHWIFLKLNSRRAAIAVIPAKLSHDLSVQSLKSLSIFRLRSILVAERTFCNALGMRARIVLPIRRLIRAFRYLSVGRPSLAAVVLASIFSCTGKRQ